MLQLIRGPRTSPRIGLPIQYLVSMHFGCGLIGSGLGPLRLGGGYIPESEEMSRLIPSLPLMRKYYEHSIISADMLRRLRFYLLSPYNLWVWSEIPAPKHATLHCGSRLPRRLHISLPPP